jgi:exopolysaccharide production protein ExoY
VSPTKFDSATARRSQPSGIRYQPEPSPAADIYDQHACVSLAKHADRNIRAHLKRVLVRVSILLVADIITLLLLRMIAHSLRMDPTLPPLAREGILALFPAGVIHAWQLSFALLIGLAATGCYGAGDRRRDIGRLFLASLLAASRQLWSPIWTGHIAIELMQTIVMTLTMAAALGLDRYFVNWFVKEFRRAQPSGTRAVLVGVEEECRLTWRRHGALGDRAFEVAGFVDLNEPASSESLGTLAHLDYVLHEQRADTVVLCGPINSDVFRRIARSALTSHSQMLTAYDEPEFACMEPAIVWREQQPYLEWRRPALRFTHLIMKRTLDMIGAGALLLVFSPIMLVIALGVRLGSSGPIFFSQKRLGRFGRFFDCYKFRSMYRDAEERLRSDPDLLAEYIANDYKLAPERDARVTPLGRFLRKSSLDELPQLWNVLIGDMSLVGPRPIVPEEIRHYQDERLLFLSVKPGVTGAWQVNGRSDVAYPARTTLELDYVSNWSLMSDIRIILQTVPAVLRREGAH